jgi:hypothetical protein
VANHATNAAPKSVPERQFDSFEKKGIVPSLKLKLAVLAKLTQIEIDLASNHGTMPR